MKIKYFIWVVLSLFCFALNAQHEHYYYYKKEKQFITLDRSKLNVTTSLEFQKETVDKFIIKNFSIKQDLNTNDEMFGDIKFSFALDEIEYNRIINLLKNDYEVVAVHPNFITADNVEIGMSSYFYVRLKNSFDYNKLIELAKQKNAIIVEQNRFLPLWYTLRCTKETPDNALNIANYFYETGLFASAVPDFLSDDLLCTNDPNFFELWGLQNNSYPNIDVHACSVWEITRGSDATVAVLDQGIELTHNDLSPNISSLSYDTESNTSPSQVFGNHGTHCAGTVGAIRNNNLQIAGVAPECILMSISNSLAATPNSRIKRADGINWAWHHGADIISNSWGSSVQYDVIDEAIDSALIYGRNGKGAVIVFASGNDYGVVSYPANSNPNIIVVGAINRNGTRASFSNYGTQLDIVAPGVDILSTIPNNSIDYMDGTSMACPHVAGVAALVLSVNPNLTQVQVQQIIESTAQKVRTDSYTYSTTSGYPNGTWNNQMGYGLVDAYAAVQAACPAIVNFTNQTVTSDTTVVSCGDINVQNVTVTNGAKLTLDAAGEVNIISDFEVELGSEFEIK